MLTRSKSRIPTARTFGFVIPANDAIPPYPCHLEELQATFPAPETDSEKLRERRFRQHVETDWGCTFTTAIYQWTWQRREEYHLIVDDFGLNDVKLPENKRATYICELSSDSGGYPVQGDAFVYVANGATPDLAFIDMLIHRGRFFYTKGAFYNKEACSDDDDD